MNWDTVQQFIRIVLQLAAGFMVQRGLLTEEMAVTATGAILSLAGVAWWAFWNKKRVE
jgi:hypothetical protein